MKIVHTTLALLLAESAMAAPVSNLPGSAPAPAASASAAPALSSQRTNDFRIEYTGPQKTLPHRLTRPSTEPGKQHELRIDYADVAGRQRPVSITESGYSHGQMIRRQINLIHDAQGKLKAIDGPLPGGDDRLSVSQTPSGEKTGAHPKAATNRASTFPLPVLQNTLGLEIDPRQLPWLQTALIIAADDWPAGLHQLGTPVPHHTRGASATIVRDDFNRTTVIQSPDLGRHTFFHDLADQLIEARDSSGARLRIELDAHGRPLTKRITGTDGFDETTRYQYQGRHLKTVHGPSFTESYQYDAQDRLVERTAIVHPAGSQQSQRFRTRFQYHQDGRKPVAMTLPNGAEIGYWRRDDRVEFIEALNFRLGKRHRGNLSIIQVAGKTRLGGEELLMHHANQLESTTWFDAERNLHAQQTLMFADIMESRNYLYRYRLRYGPDGRLSAKEVPVVPLRFSYDPAGHLTSAVWHFDTVMQAVPEADAGAASPKDRSGRIAVPYIPTLSWHYDWDERGNRTGSRLKRTHGTTRTTHQVLPGTHRYQDVPHDDSGRPLAWNGWQISWHPANVIQRMTHPDGRDIRYYYNHRGERIARQQGDEWRFYDHQDGLLQAEVGSHRPLMRTWWYRAGIPFLVLDQHEDNPAQTLDDTRHGSLPTGKGAAGSTAGTGPKKPATDQNDQPREREYKVRWVHVDQRGLPFATTTPAAYISWGQVYGPFGEPFDDLSIQTAWPRMVKHETPAERDREDPLIRFPGQWVDQETGLYTSRQGDYDPATGRYLQPQVSALPHGNPYLFMGGNPLGTAWRW